MNAEETIKDVFWRMYLDPEDFDIIPDGDNYLVAIKCPLTNPFSLHTIMEEPHLKILRLEALGDKLIFTLHLDGELGLKNAAAKVLALPKITSTPVNEGKSDA